MRLQAALFLACVSPVAAIYSDEIDHVDFHHGLVGAPSPDSTFFLKPSSASNASLLYTLSDKLILGAVNPRDGTLVWRQNLSRSAGAPAREAGLLRGLDRNNAVVSAVGNYISSWSTHDGKLVWEDSFADGVVADLKLLGLEDESLSAGTRDTIALFRGEKGGVVRRLDGDSGNTMWAFKDDLGDIPFQVSTSANELFYISLQSALLKGYRIKVNTLNPSTGEQTSLQVLNSENEVTNPNSILFVGTNTASPFIIWTDKSHKSLKFNLLGTDKVKDIPIWNPSGERIQQLTIHAPQKLDSPSHFLVNFVTEKWGWAEVYHVNLKSKTVKKAFHLPYVSGQSIVATSEIDNRAYFTRFTDEGVFVISSASDRVLRSWRLPRPSPDRAFHTVSEVVKKGKAVAVRSAILHQSGDWEFIRNGQPQWTRHETLIDAVAAAWAETDDQEDLAHELEVEGHESLQGAYIHRVKRHLRDLQYLPDWLRGLPRRVLGSILSDEVTNLNSFGLSKLVIVATKNGLVHALDTGNHGAVSWSIQVSRTPDLDVKAILTRPGIADIHLGDGSSASLNVSTGHIIRRSVPIVGGIRAVASFEETGSSPATRGTVGVREDGSPVRPFKDSNGFLVTTSADGRVLGWMVQDNKSPVWEFVPPAGQRVISATARPVHDPVASIGKVLGDRSVLYKYLNPNLALVTAVNEKDHTASFHLLDGVSGKVLHAVTHTGVDPSQPIASAMSENWFAYSFWGDVTSETSAKGYQLVVSELFESPLANDRGPLDSAGNYTSLASSGTESLPLPHVVSQAFIIPEPISHMAVTQTRQGITVRQLLCTLPASNSIIGIPRHVLDPRRPVDRSATPAETEEGLFQYTPFLYFDGKWYLSHARDVAGIKDILSSPTLLESTSLVFAYGGDIYGTRATPSQAFDILGKGFSKLQLVLTVVALAVGVAILAPITRRKQVNTLWKAI
ncbi:hypothetical protein NUU61_001930 [Penicillium alfredii]|uniref:ER membrane protein complex subunit 1 n=1 Tax=Penicillium alfredii TaxID=1506179 RepID=A0A9W9FQR3_9EURO|nr:uncharacterized protein NUU61_001930 [Penicillium alfredii]KAJ5104583.1 hypothetical protein NUU61_001930 [Penicillium alfredii]